VEINDSEETTQKYYSFGSMRVAMRTIDGETNTLQWLLSDHLGSTSIIANADGSYFSELRYSAFGEIRFSYNITPTDYRYTGQLAQAEIGLYYYGARWYDPELGRFIQADTIIPGAGNPIAWDRYAYVLNNPIRLVDPSGHWGQPLIDGEGSPKNLLSKPNNAASPRQNTGSNSSTSSNNTNNTSNTNGIFSSIASITENLVGNHRQAWEIATSGSFSAGDRVIAGGYLALEGVGALALVGGVGGLGCAAAGPGCVAAVEGALGISTSACADGDCTNEVRTASNAIPRVEQLANEISDWLGGELEVVRNEAGDFVIRNLENTRRLRFDFFRTLPHDVAHLHIDWVDEVGNWLTHRIFLNH
jgi:RHS repeat-associated protein